MINIWTVAGAQVVTNAPLIQVGTTNFWVYTFSTIVYGTNYVYTITGESSLTPAERTKYGTIYQETPDRSFGTVTATGPNSATSFTTTQTESTGAWGGAIILFLSGVLAKQIQTVMAYNSTNGAFTVSPGFTASPGTGDSYVLINY